MPRSTTRRLAQQRPPRCFDAATGDLHCLMLPNAYDSPAAVHKLPVLTLVPSNVGVELREPPVCVVLGEGPVQRASVPEAPVHEDRQPGACEGHVGTPRESSVLLAKPQASGM